MAEQQISVIDAAQHYVDGIRRGTNSERERCKRIVESELATYILLAEKNGTQFTTETKAVKKVLATVLGQI